MKLTSLLMLMVVVRCTDCSLPLGDSFGDTLNSFLFTSFASVRNTTLILSQRFHEKMAKFDVSSDKDSWGHALVRIKKFCEEEIRTIYSDVFGIDLNQLKITQANQKQLVLILCGVLLLFSTFIIRIFSLWTIFTLSLLLVSVKSIYGTPAMVHASLYLLGILLVAVNYALMYPVQSMVLLLTWQLAKYLVWFCSPSPASQSDVTGIERRLISVEQRLERAEFQLREFRQDLRQLHQ
ncbi:uncharacterized protein LOC134811042 isoform X1 [Bolinopsis microptera]|uniref:uncharacterized protein LOC134811042 isoform X1 n=1 Tax=Bolinopsis microptera TaxID=2820187 RepID=UPI003078F20D